MAKLILNGETPKVYIGVMENIERMHSRDWEYRSEGSTVLTYEDEYTLRSAWNGSILIAVNLKHPYNIDKTKYKAIKIKITTGSHAYSNTGVYQACCGIRPTLTNDYMGWSVKGWLAYELMNEYNHTYEFTFDLDQCAGNDIYFYVCCGGWDLTIDEWSLVRR